MYVARSSALVAMPVSLFELKSMPALSERSVLRLSGGPRIPHHTVHVFLHRGCWS